MIVIDENLHDRRIVEAIAAWYPGQVVSIVTLRPKTVIKDEAIPDLLSQAGQPTFVTINAPDFWKKIRPRDTFCVVAVALPKERSREGPDLLRRLFHVAGFATKASRMGKVIRVTPTHIEFYERDFQV